MQKCPVRITNPVNHFYRIFFVLRLYLDSASRNAYYKGFLGLLSKPWDQEKSLANLNKKGSSVFYSLELHSEVFYFGIE